MAAKRDMPNMFDTAPPRPPRLPKGDSKFSHHVPSGPQETPTVGTVEKIYITETAPSYVDEPVTVAGPPVDMTVKPAAKDKRVRTQKVVGPVTLAPSHDDVWAVFEIPDVVVVIPVYDDVEALLVGPLTQTPLHVLPAMEQVFQKLKANVRASGRKVSFQTLYAHGLAFAYIHADEWLAQAPSDGRREGSRSKLTSLNTRITPELPVALVDATHALAAKATIESPRQGPALESVKTAGLAWALSRYEQWLDFAVSRPIRAGEKG